MPRLKNVPFNLQSQLPQHSFCYQWQVLPTISRITLNLLCQAPIASNMSAWEHFNGPFNFDATHLDQIICPYLPQPSFCLQLMGFPWPLVIQHQTRPSPLLILPSDMLITKALLVTDIVEFCHRYLNQPTVTSNDLLLHVHQLPNSSNPWHASKT